MAVTLSARISCCSIEARGRLMIPPGTDIYEGQVIGIHQRAGDLAVNACKRKAATNIRRCAALPGLGSASLLDTASDPAPLQQNIVPSRIRLALSMLLCQCIYVAATLCTEPMMVLRVHAQSLCYACSATKDATVVLSPPIVMSLDDCLEYIVADELVEVRASASLLFLLQRHAVLRCVSHSCIGFVLLCGGASSTWGHCPASPDSVVQSIDGR